MRLDGRRMILRPSLFRLFSPHNPQSGIVTVAALVDVKVFYTFPRLASDSSAVGCSTRFPRGRTEESVHLLMSDGALVRDRQARRIPSAGRWSLLINV